MITKVKYILTIFLTIFSFYYTDYIINKINDNTLLMSEIKNKSYKYHINAIPGKLDNSTIVPGIKGKRVNINKSFNNMKLGGVFREDALIYDYINPNELLDNNYDKFIKSGNNIKKEISLIYIFNKKDIFKLSKINYLNIFINSKDINIENISKINKNNLYFYGDNGNYKISGNKNILKSISMNKNDFCLSINKDYKILSECMKNNIHTITPSIEGGYYEIKRNLTNGSIILLNDLNNINMIKKYIESKGIKIVFLEELLRE